MQPKTYFSLGFDGQGGAASGPALSCWAASAHTSGVSRQITPVRKGRIKPMEQKIRLRPK